MKRRINSIIFLLLTISSLNAESSINGYYFNKPPLIKNKYSNLDLGDIEPEGWLETQLKNAANGMTGHLDEVYGLVGYRNGWIGGNGDGWERGPYWLDGLLPLGYILNDSTLIQKSKKWIDWSLNSQQESGYFGPRPFKEEPEFEPGLQKTRRKDWWPHMIMLKVLQQYYSATKDERVLKLMTKYFRYQLRTLPDKPLDYWSVWSENRGGENLASVIWLYNRTEDEFLLELAELLISQTSDWFYHFRSGSLIVKNNTLHNSNHWSLLHGVNIAMALKQPILQYLIKKDKELLNSVTKAMNDLKEYHGQVQGMYGADELLHGTDPTHGSELCTAVELMYSLESIIPFTKNMEYAEKLEKVAFNALPAQISPNFTTRQYYQQPNQIRASIHKRNFITTDDDNDRISFGLLTGYPCCTANMHQAWPKFVQNLYYATSDSGVAVFIYAPSRAKVSVSNGISINIEEKTQYPFDEKIEFNINPEQIVRFPFYLRVPGWCQNPHIEINGMKQKFEVNKNIVVLDRKWKKGDKVVLNLPMKIAFTNWHENLVGIERGPLVYALKIEAKCNYLDGPGAYSTYELHPKTPWNYGIFNKLVKKPNTINITKHEQIADQPWKSENAPIELHLVSQRIPFWKEYNETAGPTAWSYRNLKTSLDTITLIPYGSSRLRISEFPIIYRE